SKRSYSTTTSTTNEKKKKSKTTNKATAPAAGNGLISDEKALIGTRYQLGGTTPSAFDCSGFTSYVFAQNGISLPRTAAGQYSALPKISKNQIQPGDIVFFSSSSRGKSITQV